MRNEKMVFTEMLGWSEAHADKVIALLNWCDVLEIPIEVVRTEISDNGDDLKRYMAWAHGIYRFIRERLYTVLTEDLGRFLSSYADLDDNLDSYDADMDKLYKAMEIEIKRGLAHFGQWIGMDEAEIFGECLQVVTEGE